MRILVFTNMYPFEAMPFYGSFVADEVRALRAAGVDVDLLFINGIASKLNYFASPTRFFAQIRRADYDVVHVHHSFCGLVATWQKRIPVVWTFHEGEITRDPSVVKSDKWIKKIAYSKGLKRSVARKVDVLIAVSEHLIEPLQRPDAVVIPAGVDTESFKPMDRAEAIRQIGVDPHRRYVLFPSAPGRVEKRYQLAAEAVGKLRDSGTDDVELLCLDRVPHEKVPLYMNACEAMLMTSEFEASPVTIREALACDVPVLSTDVGDARTVLADIDGCYIVEADPEKIAATLSQSLAGEGRVAGHDAMQKYSLQTVTQKVITVYEQVMSSHRTPTP